jgi:hypothetical protein
MDDLFEGRWYMGWRKHTIGTPMDGEVFSTKDVADVVEIEK